MNQCTFCGSKGNYDTINVGGYTVLLSCEDCEREILDGDDD